MLNSINLIIMVISPLGGFISNVSQVLSNKSSEISKTTLLALSLFMGFLNNLKIPQSDLINYIDYYIQVSNNSLIQYINLIDKEPAFLLLNYIFFHLFFGNETIYIIAITTLAYFIYLYGIQQLVSRYAFNSRALFVGIIVCLFFPNLFALSGHLIRQFLAGSLAFLFVVEYESGSKVKSIIYIILAILIHASASIFLIALLPFLSKGKNFSISVLIILFITFLEQILTQIKPFFSNIEIASYAINRYLNRANAFWSTDYLGVLSFLIQFAILFALFWASSKIKKDTLLSRFYYLTVFLIAFVGVNFNHTEIATRFGFYIYFLLPVVFIYLYLILPRIGRRLILLSTPIIFIPWFIYKLFHGVWTFERFHLLFWNF